MMHSSHCIRYMTHDLISPIIGDINIDHLTKEVSDDSTVVIYIFLL